MDEMQYESVMNETTNYETERPAQRPAVPSQRPRNKKRPKTKQELFKENTLPLIILSIAAVLILTFIIGSIVRGVQKRKIETEASIAASESMAAEEARLTDEMNAILASAEECAIVYDYETAIALIDNFSGNIGAYPQLQDARVRYEYEKSTLIPWEDPNEIINLSFQTLIADPARAFSNESHGSSMRQNYITVSEFQKILEDLYANDYILVSLRDIAEIGTTTAGTMGYKYKELYLPEGKKPVILTQTNVNYPLSLVDSDEDMIADQGGVGIASKLVLDADGSITCEMVDANGTVTTGAYDLIPILDAFVKAHPDFSYRGAKAVLALTGYNGLFGYRTHAAGRDALGEDAYARDMQTVQSIAEALKASGYELGCYTYNNRPYGVYSLSEIQADMNLWNDEVVSILGQMDIMVFAQSSDISEAMLYSGEKYDYLKSLGYNYYLGFSSNGDPFTFIADEYVRQGRLMVTGDNLIHNADWFNGIFSTEELMDEAR